MFASDTDNDRGQVGIGTLIVFIAMVLVAAIAAGVLINTAGFLQTQAEATGEESTEQVSNNIQLISSYGTVDAASEVDNVSMTAGLSAGSGAIDMTETTIQIIGPDGAETLTHVEESPGVGEFTTEGIGDTQDDVLVNRSDRMTIEFELEDSGNLASGESADVTVTLSSGAQVVEQFNAPNTLEIEDEGNQVEL